MTTIITKCPYSYAKRLTQHFLTFFYLSTPFGHALAVQHPYDWLKPSCYKVYEKTSAVHHIPFSFDRHICDLPQHHLNLMSAPPGGASTLG